MSRVAFVFAGFGAFIATFVLAMLVLWKTLRSMNDICDEMHRLDPEDRQHVGWPDEHLMQMTDPLVKFGLSELKHRAVRGRLLASLLLFGAPEGEAYASVQEPVGRYRVWTLISAVAPFFWFLLLARFVGFQLVEVFSFFGVVFLFEVVLMVGWFFFLARPWPAPRTAS